VSVRVGCPQEISDVGKTRFGVTAGPAQCRKKGQFKAEKAAKAGGPPTFFSLFRSAPHVPLPPDEGEDEDELDGMGDEGSETRARSIRSTQGSWTSRAWIPTLWMR
jgi:hypothetical protein